ncbi:MAG TPA: serine protease [bacterium]|nr:serine protease [bacterium]
MAVIPLSFIDSVVAIGSHPSGGNATWGASGFLYATLRGTTAGRNEYGTYLVTNRHVLDGLTDPSACVRINPKGSGPAREFPISLKRANGLPWHFGHPDPNVDVAVMPVNMQVASQAGVSAELIKSDSDVSTVSALASDGVAEGSLVYVLGFPMSLVGVARNTVIVRAGCIASMQETLTNPRVPMLVDAPIFPGNSGGPVVLRGELLAIKGTKPQMRASVIGVAASYLTYEDVACSLQTGKPRVSFTENSGLSLVFPMDCVIEAISLAESVVHKGATQPVLGTAPTTPTQNPAP